VYRLAPPIAIVLLGAPVALGLIGVLLPAFGYLPALGGTGFSLEPWRLLFDQPGLWRAALVCLLCGLVTPAVALVVAALFLAGAQGTWLYRAIRTALSPLLAVPHAAAAFGLAFLIAPSGLIVRWLSPWLTGWERPPDALIVHDPWGGALMAGLILKEIPFLLLMALAALPQVDAARRAGVARSLGYRPVTAWLKAVAPGLYPLLRLPIYAVIAFASSSVDVALILGPSNPPTLSVAVLRWFGDADLELRYVASAGAVMQLGVTLAALGLWRLAEWVVGRLVRGWLEGGGRGAADALLVALGRGAAAVSAATAMLGLAGLALASFAGYWRFPDSWPAYLTAGHWLRAGPALGTPLLSTLLIGALATLISLLLVIGSLENEVRRGRPLGAAALRLLYLPLIVPQIGFLFGLAIGVEAAGLRPGPWLVLLGHIVFVLPYVYLSLAEAYRRLDPRWAMVARTLGASPDRAFLRVRLPLLFAPCLTAAAVGLAVSIGLYLPTMLLGAGRVPTLATEAVALAAGGDRRAIGVWALLQAVLPALGFALALLLPRLLFRQRRALREVAR
jgi:putative thiamine transport system permease protein